MAITAFFSRPLFGLSVEMLLLATSSMIPRIRHYSASVELVLPEFRPDYKGANFTRIAIEYLAHIANSEPLNPFKHRMLKYFSFYIK